MEFDHECPFCHISMPKWRIDFANEFKDNDGVRLDAVGYNPDLSAEHALYHVPENY